MLPELLPPDLVDYYRMTHSTVPGEARPEKREDDEENEGASPLPPLAAEAGQINQ